MHAALKEEIEKSIPVEGEIEYYTKSHKKGPGPLRHKCLPPEDLVYEKNSKSSPKDTATGSTSCVQTPNAQTPSATTSGKRTSSK